MSSSTLQSDPTSCASLKNKWPKKEGTLEPWTKFKTCSKNSNQNTSGPPSKSYGWKTFLPFARRISTLPLPRWWMNLLNSKLILRPSKLSTTPLETENSTLLLKSLKLGRNFALPLAISILTARYFFFQLDCSPQRFYFRPPERCHQRSPRLRWIGERVSWPIKEGRFFGESKVVGRHYVRWGGKALRFGFRPMQSGGGVLRLH